MRPNLLSTALERQDYVLAAHILVYGLIKASIDSPRNTATARRRRQRHANKRKRQEKE